MQHIMLNNTQVQNACQQLSSLFISVIHWICIFNWYHMEMQTNFQNKNTYVTDSVQHKIWQFIKMYNNMNRQAALSPSFCMWFYENKAKERIRLEQE